MTKLGVIVGSIRDRSWNRKVANALVEMFPADWEAQFLEIDKLPLYNGDVDEKDFTGTMPAAITELREAAGSVDAFLIVTPEYNRGVPGVLKNAIDVLSRPYGAPYFPGKPVMLVSSSTGLYGGFGANHALRQTMVFLDAHVLAQPEMYLGKIHEAFGNDPMDKLGSPADPATDNARLTERTRAMMQGAVDKFVAFAGHWL